MLPRELRLPDAPIRGRSVEALGNRGQSVDDLARLDDEDRGGVGHAGQPPDVPHLEPIGVPTRIAWSSNVGVIVNVTTAGV